MPSLPFRKPLLPSHYSVWFEPPDESGDQRREQDGEEVERQEQDGVPRRRQCDSSHSLLRPFPPARLSRANASHRQSASAGPLTEAPATKPSGR